MNPNLPALETWRVTLVGDRVEESVGHLELDHGTLLFFVASDLVRVYNPSVWVRADAVYE